MNREMINDFVNIWAKTIGLVGEKNKKYVNFIKTDIARRCSLYENEIRGINVKDDNCEAYIIKPVDNEYSLDAFLLNRLMLGLRGVDFTGALEGAAGNYVASEKYMDINTNLIESLVKEKAKKYNDLEEEEVHILQKTIEHELGHCFKTSFNNGFKRSFGKGREQDEIYKKLIDNLAKFENGKYVTQIKSIKDFDLESYSEKIKTGVNDYCYNHEVDELLNETEALKLSKSNKIHKKQVLKDKNGRNAASENYVNVYNYISGYRSFSGYGEIFKSILGKENTFKAEYIFSRDILQQFDQEYKEIVEEVWNLDSQNFSPIKCISDDFCYLRNKKEFDEKTMLKLDEFFAKCYQKKVDKIFNDSDSKLNSEMVEKILKEIEVFELKLTTNEDSNKREKLVHNVIFNNIKIRIDELSKHKGNPQLNNKEEKPKNFSGEVKKKNQEIINNIDNNKKQAFIEGLIEAYNDTETNEQYEKRKTLEEKYIKMIMSRSDTIEIPKSLKEALEEKNIVDAGNNVFKGQYSGKQVSIMVRMLKAAQLCTNNKKINSEGKNYYQELIDNPFIEEKLREMKEDFKKPNSYMYGLREKAKENRAKGSIPNYAPTKGEIEVDKTLNKVNSNELSKNNTSYKMSVDSIEECILDSKVTTSEVNNQIRKTKNDLNIKRLKFEQQIGGGVLTDKEKRMIEEHNRQFNQAQIDFINSENERKNKKKGLRNGKIRGIVT